MILFCIALFVIIAILVLLFNHGAHKGISREEEDREEMRILAKKAKSKKKQ